MFKSGQFDQIIVILESHYNCTGRFTTNDQKLGNKLSYIAFEGKGNRESDVIDCFC